LFEGKEYVVDSVYYNWRGVVNTQKDSFIADYIFCKFLQNAWFNSTSGVKQIKSENSENVDNSGKIMQVYNGMIDKIREMWAFIDYQNSVNASTYPNFEPEDLTKFLYFL
jgi:hypothetical protein